MQYVREELSNLRSAVHDELTAMRTDISGLAGEMRGYMAQVAPRMAVLEHRLSEAEKDIAAIQATRADDKKLRWAVAAAVIAAVTGWVPGILALMGH